MLTRSLAHTFKNVSLVEDGRPVQPPLPQEDRLHSIPPYKIFRGHSFYSPYPEVELLCINTMAYLSGQLTVAMLWVMEALELGMVGLRLWANKFRGRGHFSPGDYCILATVILTIPAIASVTYSVHLELNHEEAAKLMNVPTAALMTEEEIKIYLKLSVEHVIFYYILVWLVKFSILSLFVDLRNRLTRTNRIGLAVLTAFIAATFVVSLITLLTVCSPATRMWVSPLNPAYCSIVNRQSVIPYFVMTILADIAILCYTIRLLRSLNLHRRALWGIAVVILSGLVSIAASIIRFTLTMKIITDLHGGSSTLVGQSTLFTATEYFFGILASCLPAYRLLFRKPEGSSMASSSQHTPRSWFSSALAKARARNNRRPNLDDSLGSVMIESEPRSEQREK